MRRPSIALCIAVAACGSASWKKTAALPAGDGIGCTSVLVDQEKIFVGTSSGLAVTTDDGQSWADSSGGQLTRVGALTLNGAVMLAGTDKGTFASGDRGATWSPAGTGLPGTVQPYTFWNIGAVTLVGLSGGSASGGVFRTADHGAQWTASSTGLDPGSGAASFAQLSATVFAAVELAIARSTDDGKSWTTSASPGGVNPVALATLDGTLYVATANAGMFKTTDGIVFNAVDLGLPSGETLSALFVNDGRLYAGTDKQGIFMSANGGATWSAINEGYTDRPRVVQFGVHGARLIAVTQTAGVWMRDL